MKKGKSKEDERDWRVEFESAMGEEWGGLRRNQSVCVCVCVCVFFFFVCLDLRFCLGGDSDLPSNTHLVFCFMFQGHCQ
jgi:hypothetical protein